MRIGQLTDCYAPVLNGVTNFVRTHKAQLTRLGHQAPVYTTGHRNHPDPEPDVYRSWGIPLGTSGYHAAAGYDRRAQNSLATMDLLHAHHPFFAGQFALRYGRRFDQPVVYTNHTRLDLYAATYLPRPIYRLVRPSLYRYMRRFTASCDLVIAPSAGLADLLQNCWGAGGRVVVVPNGVDFDRFRQPSALLSRTDLGLPSDSPIAIYTGRLGPEKNLPFLLEAFARASPQETGSQLLLLGDGPEGPRLRSLAHNLGLTGSVRFLGAVPYARVPAMLALADLFVTPSVSEVHPMSLIEALVAGLPALGVRSPGTSDTIQDGVNGLLTEPEPAAFGRALRRLCSDDALRERLARGAQTTSERYAIARTSATIVRLYGELLAQKRQDPTAMQL